MFLTNKFLALLLVFIFLVSASGNTARLSNTSGSAVPIGSLARPPPPGLLKVTQGMTITRVPIPLLDRVFSVRDWVVRLTDCLVDAGYCNMKFGLALHRHLNAVNSGTSELCPGCDRQTKLAQLRSLIKFISYMQTPDYEDQWKRVKERFTFVSNIRL